MTPKEKAKYLVDKMSEFQLLSNKLDYPDITKEFSKQHALIAVDEMQLIMTSLWKVAGIDEQHRSTYLEEVKKEIEKL